jgi:hypothetical protein
MTCQLILTNKVCAAVLLLWVMEAMFNRILFCCNGHQGTVLRFVEVLNKTSLCPIQQNISIFIYYLVYKDNSKKKKKYALLNILLLQWISMDGTIGLLKL